MSADWPRDFAILSTTEGWDESSWYYRPGGLPPVDVGDRFHNERFTILHKLGSGYSSTVWLARDAVMRHYVALKMLKAEHSSLGMQMKIQDFLLQQGKEPLHAHILKILETFEFISPNGKHTCLVFELAGPSLQKIRGSCKFKPETARRFSKDIAGAIKYLHQNSIAFGDLSTENILLRIKDLSHNDEATVVELFGGEPEMCDLYSIPGKEAYRHHGPRHQYNSYEPQLLGLDMLDHEIVLTDLNEAVMVSDEIVSDAVAQGDSAVHMDIAAPEYVFGLNRRHSLASDIWSLACCFFEIRSCKPLIRGASDIVGLIGSLPASWISSIKSSEEHGGLQALSCVEKARFNEVQTLRQKIEGIYKWHPWTDMTWEERRQFYIKHIGRDYGKDPEYRHRLEDRPLPPARLSDEEAHDFYDLMSKMLCYIPSERITIDEVLAHPWLNKTYSDLDEPADWISNYATGDGRCMVNYWQYAGKTQSGRDCDDSAAKEEVVNDSLENAGNFSKDLDEAQVNEKNDLDQNSSTSDEDSSTVSDGVSSVDNEEMTCSGIVDQESINPESSKRPGDDH